MSILLPNPVYASHRAKPFCLCVMCKILQLYAKRHIILAMEEKEREKREKMDRGASPPKTPRRQNRFKKYLLSLTPEEHETLKEIAKTLETNMADLIRDAINDYIKRYGVKMRLKKTGIRRHTNEDLETIRQVVRDLTYEINKIGVNINQIAKYTNQKRDIDIYVAVRLQIIYDSLKKMYAEVMKRLPKEVR